MEAARPALLSDDGQVTALRAEFQQALRGARGAKLLQAERAEISVPWSLWVGDPGRCAVVGTLESHVVGYGLARLHRVGPDVLLGVVEEVWVEAGARGVGVGEAVMELVTAWCVEQGCSGMDAAALPGDRIMKGFFERYGMTARLLMMHRALPGSPG